MIKKKVISTIGSFEEEINIKDFLKDFSDETSYENHIAALSHYLHNHHKKMKKAEKAEIVKAIHDFLSRNDARPVKNIGEKSNVNSLMISEAPVQYDLFSPFFDIPFPSPGKPKFTFIDLFAGIGGFRLAMQNLGGKCVYSSEIDINAQKTYFHNFGEVPFGDITKDSTKSFIPKEIDVLCGGFPCQAFSIAGYQRGFEDTRGTLFFDVAKIIKDRRPKAFFLENVKNLKSHDHGKTFKVIKETLESLNYAVFEEVLNTMEYANVPQNRERIFIIGFNKDVVDGWNGFEFPGKMALTHTIHDCIDYSVSDKSLFYTEKFPHYDLLVKDMKNPDTIYQWRRQYVRENQSNVCPTLTANMGTGGHNVPLIITNDGFRKLTPKECINFQGFPEEYSFPDDISNAMKYKQAGNSVTVPLIQRVAENLLKVIL